MPLETKARRFSPRPRLSQAGTDGLRQHKDPAAPGAIPPSRGSFLPIASRPPPPPRPRGGFTPTPASSPPPPPPGPISTPQTPGSCQPGPGIHDPPATRSRAVTALKTLPRDPGWRPVTSGSARGGGAPGPRRHHEHRDAGEGRQTGAEEPQPHLHRVGDRPGDEDEGRARGADLQGGRQDGQHQHLGVGRCGEPHPARGHHPPHQGVRLRLQGLPDPLHRARGGPAEDRRVLHGVLRGAQLQRTQPRVRGAAVAEQRGPERERQSSCFTDQPGPPRGTPSPRQPERERAEPGGPGAPPQHPRAPPQRPHHPQPARPPRPHRRPRQQRQGDAEEQQEITGRDPPTRPPARSAGGGGQQPPGPAPAPGPEQPPGRGGGGRGPLPPLHVPPGRRGVAQDPHLGPAGLRGPGQDGAEPHSRCPAAPRVRGLQHPPPARAPTPNRCLPAPRQVARTRRGGC